MHYWAVVVSVICIGYLGCGLHIALGMATDQYRRDMIHYDRCWWCRLVTLVVVLTLFWLPAILACKLAEK